MKRNLIAAIAVGALALACLAAPPNTPLPSPLLTPVPALAAPATKPLAGGGGGNIGGAGERFGDLLSGWAVPVLIALAGVFLVGALTARNIGAGVGVVVITLVGLIFLLSPQSIEAAAKGIAGAVF
jgi:hypothetical protein